MTIIGQTQALSEGGDGLASAQRVALASLLRALCDGERFAYST